MLLPRFSHQLFIGKSEYFMLTGFSSMSAQGQRQGNGGIPPRDRRNRLNKSVQRTALVSINSVIRLQSRPELHFL